MKYNNILLAIAILFSTSLYSQKVLTTNSGQRILLVDDGSWRIIEETESVDGKSSDAGTSLESFKSPKQGKHPVNPDQLEEIQNLMTNFLSDEAQLMVNIEMAKRKLDQLKKEKSNIKKDKVKTEKVKYQIELTKGDIKADEKIYKATSKLIDVSNELLEGKIKNKDKAFAALRSNNKAFEAINSGMGGHSEEPEIQESASTQEDILEQETVEKKYPTLFAIDNGRERKNDYDCEIIFDGYDSDIGSDRKEVKTQPFFSYTLDKMKPYFKTEDYLTCDANISKVGKKYFLTLNIRIKSKDAKKTYGVLRANENIKIQMINSKSIYGKSINNDNGEIESYTGNTLYTGIFQLNKDDIKDLKKTYLDNVGIIWSSGYEEYNIYNVDFLTNQLECLNK